jgi:hypothetical protein
MGYSINYNAFSKCVIRSYFAEVTSAEIMEALQKVFAFINQGVIGSLSDYSGVTSVNVKSDDILGITTKTKEISNQLPNLTIALVADNPQIIAMIRMWEVLSHDTRWTIHLFKSREEAEAWLCNRLGIDAIQ